MEKNALLDHIQDYVDLTTEDKNMILNNVKFRRYLKGQFIVQQGDVCNYDCFVLNGCTRTFHLDYEGQEHTVMIAIENWWTGDLESFITQTPADFNVQCLGNTNVAQFSHDSLEYLFQHVPQLERFFRLILQEAYVASQNRIIRNFSLPAKERYLKFKQRHPSIEQRVPQYMIASYLGITKEFLSKIKKQIISES